MRNSTGLVLFLGDHQDIAPYLGCCIETERCSLDETGRLQSEFRRIRPSWLVGVAKIENEQELDRSTALLGSWVPEARLAIIDLVVDVGRCDRWLRRGASIYVGRRAAQRDLGRMLDVCRDLGVLVLDEQVGWLLLKERAAVAALDSLTERELDVLRCLAQGMANAKIAEACVVSIHTVEFHLRHIFEKLGVRSRLEAAARARSLAV